MLNTVKRAQNQVFRKRLALPPSDPSLAKPQVLAPVSLTHMTKQIEQVGQGYEALKKRYAALELKMQIGASANFSDEEDDISSDVSDETKRKRAYSIEQAEKKRHVKSREEIEKIALENGDLYAILELEHKTWEAKDKEIRKGY